MPNYEYECFVCKNVDEEIRKVKNRDDIKFCPKCGNEMSRLISVNSRSVFWGTGIDMSNTTGIKGTIAHSQREVDAICKKHGVHPISRTEVKNLT